MIYTVINGGLGNQLFQYAIARKIGHYKNEKVALVNENRSEFPYLLNKFKLDGIEASQVCSHNNSERFIETLPAKIIPELCSNNFHKETKHTFLQGYWQAPIYFESIRDILISEIEPKESSCIQTVEGLLTDEETCAIHIRRNDRVNVNIKKIYGLCTEKYYLEGIDKLELSLGRGIHKFFVFTDEQEWLNENYRKIFRDIDDVSVCQSFVPAEEQLYIMSLCDHFIIPNSTFSWWGAWLGKNEEKRVICPNRWTLDDLHNSIDIIPNSGYWIKQPIE